MQLFLVILMTLAGEATPLRPGDHRRAIEAERRESSSLVHVPLQYSPDRPMAVLHFHGDADDSGLSPSHFADDQEIRR